MSRAMIFEANSTFQEILENIFRSRFPSVELLAVADTLGAMEKVEGFLPLAKGGEEGFSLKRLYNYGLINKRGERKHGHKNFDSGFCGQPAERFLQ